MHMGIGYMGDRIRLRNGLALDPEPHGPTARAVNELDPQLRNKAMETALLATIRDRKELIFKWGADLKGTEAELKEGKHGN